MEPTPHGDARDKFALMLHDRLVALETDLQTLKPAPPDRRVALLGSSRTCDAGAAFVRMRSARPVDLDAWCEGVLRALAARCETRYDAWCCQHWSLGQGERPYVVEALVERSGGEPLDVVNVAHAALDAAPDQGACAETAAVVSRAWFAESIRAAAAASDTAVLRSWDPVARRMTRQDINDLDETGARTPAETAAWTMLYGWLASQTERTDVWHPHAPAACKGGNDLVAALARTLDAAV